MATFIPEKPQGQASPGVLTVYRTLRKLPDSYTIWHGFTARRPHFLILSAEQKAFLIQVAETSEELAQSTLQLELLDSTSNQLTPDNFAIQELEILEHFPVAKTTPILRLVLFPNTYQNTLDQISIQRNQNTQTQFLSLRQSSPESFLQNLEKRSQEPLPDPALFELRKAFTPVSYTHLTLPTTPYV